LNIRTPSFPRLPSWCPEVIQISSGWNHKQETSGHLTYKLVGKTRDDAAGEAYDKVGKASRAANIPEGRSSTVWQSSGIRKPFDFRFRKSPIARWTFSFSGVKTAVLRIVKTENLAPKNEEESRQDPARLDLLASFQESVVEMLWYTTHKAVNLLQPHSLMLSGGVAANSRLKEYLAERQRNAD
jgi:N6-L-threonylcarbamoyladenine synthase